MTYKSELRAVVHEFLGEYGVSGRDAEDELLGRLREVVDVYDDEEESDEEDEG